MYDRYKIIVTRDCDQRLLRLFIAAYNGFRSGRRKLLRLSWRGSAMKLEATHLREDLYAVRPQGALGTCGWAPEPWTVQYVRARSAEEALRKATGDQQ